MLPKHLGYSDGCVGQAFQPVVHSVAVHGLLETKDYEDDRLESLSYAANRMVKGVSECGASRNSRINGRQGPPTTSPSPAA